MLKLKSPIIVDFEITDKCSYNCFFCEADIPNKSGIQLLTTEECFLILDKLANAGVFYVFLTGGEPFLRDDLPEIVKHCLDIGLDPCISTNGFYLPQSVVQKLYSVGLKHIQVSIHGPEGIHDSIVGIPNSFHTVLNNLKKLLSIGFSVEIACVGLRENFAFIPKLMEQVALMGVKHFRILRYVPGYRRTMLEHIPPRELVRETIPKIKEIACKHEIDLMLNTCPGLSLSRPHIFEGIHPFNFMCPAGKVEFTILPNGDVYPCTFFRYKSEMFVGNILESDVPELWNHPSMVKLRELTPNDYKGICGNCDRKWFCYSARCVAYNLADDLYGDDLSCYIVREKMKLTPEVSPSASAGSPFKKDG